MAAQREFGETARNRQSADSPVSLKSREAPRSENFASLSEECRVSKTAWRSTSLSSERSEFSRVIKKPSY
jgi:hypothetical protein